VHIWEEFREEVRRRDGCRVQVASVNLHAWVREGVSNDGRSLVPGRWRPVKRPMGNT
jgi:hypothetical protein